MLMCGYRLAVIQRTTNSLELAVSGRGSHIVTGDSDLLALHPFQGIQILPPHRFLELPFPPRS